MTELADTDVLWLRRQASQTAPQNTEPAAEGPPSGLPIHRVYCWLFDDFGRALVQITDRGFALPSGAPDALDRNLSETLRRRSEERVQVIVSDTGYLGYNEDFRGGQQCALVWMVGRIERFVPRWPEAIRAGVLGRWLTSLDEATYLLGWGTPMSPAAAAAATFAATRWGLPVHAPTRDPEHVE